MNLAITHKLDITSNMDELAKSLKQDIQKKYDIIVTEDSLPETKKLMAEINKNKDDFKQKYKDFKNEVLAPFIPLDAKAKEIESYFSDARSALDNQVKNFEKGKLETIRLIVEEYKEQACLSSNISPDAIVVADLIILTAVTTNSKGYTIAKKTIDSIYQRIQAVELQIAKAKLEAEEKARYEREIADKARIEAEERARFREAELLARAEREKQEALIQAEKDKTYAIQKAIEEEKKRNTIAEEEKFTTAEETTYNIAFLFEVTVGKDVKSDNIMDTIKDLVLSKEGVEKLKSVKIL